MLRSVFNRKEFMKDEGKRNASDCGECGGVFIIEAISKPYTAKTQCSDGGAAS